MIDTMTRERDHHTSQTRTNPGIGEVLISIRNRLQRHDKIHPSRILADNPYQIRLIPQCLTGLEIETRAIPYQKKFPTSNDGNQPNMVRLTTTGVEINGLTGLCPLNY